MTWLPLALSATGGRQMYNSTIEDLIEAAETNDGFCLACGERAYGVEPDARRYECDCCGALSVYGAEELILQGMYA